MKKCIFFGGRLLALLFILSTIFGTSAVYAKSNAWDEWQAVVAQDNVSDDDLLMSVKNTFAVEFRILVSNRIAASSFIERIVRACSARFCGEYTMSVFFCQEQWLQFAR